MSETKFRRKKDLPSTHLLGTGTPMCAGCGGLEAIHQIYDILGENTVFISATRKWGLTRLLERISHILRRETHLI